MGLQHLTLSFVLSQAPDQKGLRMTGSTKPVTKKEPALMAGSGKGSTKLLYRPGRFVTPHLQGTFPNRTVVGITVIHTLFIGEGTSLGTCKHHLSLD